MEKPIIIELRNYFNKELPKYKKNQLVKIYAQVTGSERQGKKNQLTDVISEYILTLLKRFLLQIEENKSKEELRYEISSFLNEKLSRYTLFDLIRGAERKIAQHYSYGCYGENFNIPRPGRSGQENILNVWKFDEETFMECLCPKAPLNLELQKKKIICYSCNRQCHYNCFWQPERDNLYECPFCYIKKYHPGKEVKKIIFAGYLPALKKQKGDYRINFTLDSQTKGDKSLVVQARCVKFNSKNRYEMSWPDSCCVSLGKSKIQQFRPLPNNTPLKRRNDDPVKLQKAKLGRENELVIEEKSVNDHQYKVNKKTNHLIMIVAYTELSKYEIIERFKKCKNTIEQSQQIAKEYLTKGSQQLMIEKLSVSLKCQFYGMRMSIPVRSRQCFHYQPFDMQNFIRSSLLVKTSNKKWKCPICDKRSYDIVIDSYLWELMEKNKKAMEITLKNDGQPEIIERQDSESQEEKEDKLFESKIQEKVSFINLQSDEEQNDQERQIMPVALSESERQQNHHSNSFNVIRDKIIEESEIEKKKRSEEIEHQQNEQVQKQGERIFRDEEKQSERHKKLKELVDQIVNEDSIVYSQKRKIEEIQRPEPRKRRLTSEEQIISGDSVKPINNLSSREQTKFENNYVEILSSDEQEQSWVQEHEKKQKQKKKSEKNDKKVQIEENQENFENEDQEDKNKSKESERSLSSIGLRNKRKKPEISERVVIIEISDSEEDLNELNKEKMLISRFTERLNYDTKLLKKYENERTITDRDEDYFEQKCNMLMID